MLPRSACLRLILFCTCAALCAGAPWPMPGWVWRDVRSVFGFVFTADASVGVGGPGLEASA